MDRLDGGRRGAERLHDLVATRAVDVEAEAADLEFVGIRAADVEPDHVPRGDAHAIGVGVDALDDLRPVRGDRRRLRGRAGARPRSARGPRSPRWPGRRRR